MKRTFQWVFWPLLALLILIHTEASEPLFMLPQLVGVLLLPLVYIGAELSLTKPQQPLLRRLWPIAAAGIGSFLLMIPIWNWQENLTVQRAEHLIARLGTYQRQHGRYPDSLAQLAAQQRLAVPTTANGLFRPRAFHYIPDTTGERGAKGFWLQYYAGAMVEASYNSRSKQWSYED